MCPVSCRTSGRREEPAGHRPHYQLPQGALGASRGRRQAVPDHLCPGCRRKREHGLFFFLFLDKKMIPSPFNIVFIVLESPFVSLSAC